MVQLGSTTIVAQTVRPSGVTPQREPSHTLRGVPIKLSISLTDLSQLAKEAPRADGSQASLPEALAVQDPSTSPTESLTVPSPPTSDFEVTPDDPHAPIAPWLHGKSPAQGSHLPEGEEGGALESKGEGEGALKGTVKKQAWTADEDAKLLELIQRHGPSNWSRIAADLPSRIGKQCRERWHNRACLPSSFDPSFLPSFLFL